jgi:hypothetical protein
MHSRHVTGEHLEVLGKQAAARWQAGEFPSLTEAVTDMVKSAHLSPEQVKRVIEFCNTAAYLNDFKKEGAPHRVIEFSGGPADASEILKDLNDGGGGTVFDTGSDYDLPPAKEAMEKAASAHDDGALAALFGSEPEENLPYANPHAEVIELKDKLASAADHLQSEISGLEIVFAELGNRVYHQVKQASLEGYSLGNVLQAWAEVAPSEEYIKVAFELMTPRLLREEVFRSLSQMNASVDKIASAVVNTEHPLVTEFTEFCEALSTLAEKRAAREETLYHHGNLENYLKTASTAGDIYRGAKGVTRRAAQGAAPFVSKHLGETAGGIADKAIRYSPELAAAAALSEAHTHLKNDPMLQPVRSAYDFGMQQIPGTQQNLLHKYQLQTGQ